MKALCIGGPADGAWKEIPNTPYLRVVTQWWSPLTLNEPSVATTKEGTYKIERILGMDGEYYTVLISDEVEVENFLGTLLQGYAPTAKAIVAEMCESERRYREENLKRKNEALKKRT